MKRKQQQKLPRGFYELRVGGIFGHGIAAISAQFIADRTGCEVEVKRHNSKRWRFIPETKDFALSKHLGRELGGKRGKK